MLDLPAFNSPRIRRARLFDRIVPPIPPPITSIFIIILFGLVALTFLYEQLHARHRLHQNYQEPGVPLF